ncbi:interferon-induced GTP-binding protein Mx1-like [Alligator mississippiensis]|uniref:interferon-induced GTP-binding protein Mx1-like n=1 Tax=Alligator mississippiensis TaxID=8496 RepID=UPI0003D07DD0|nr:interferon-induced GTP-binding protein Mx1-like [Alligator mississippiensis]
MEAQSTTGLFGISPSKITFPKVFQTPSNTGFAAESPSQLQAAPTLPLSRSPIPVVSPLSTTTPPPERNKSIQQGLATEHHIESEKNRHQREKTQQGEIYASEEKNKKEENTLYNQYEMRIRPCIDLVDSLRALGIEKDLALPAIAVIGDQSSGKSSVLEALSGVALPRGSGIVTRCPLELKLRKTPEQVWKGKISYQGMEEKLENPMQVEKAIRKAQNIIAGEGVGISQELISLEISSPDVPDLTLIDLPGIVRVAVGNQPTDIGEQIKNLIKKFIVKRETINLVVISSNVDLATTEALKMAQEVDPEGERTLGILTKPDLLDKGTEHTVVDIVQNRVILLRKGYMMVKCRAQQDIQNNITLASAIQEERKFFENHKYFGDLLKEKKATIPLLAEKLTNELVIHISKSLPALEERVSEELRKAIEKLQKNCGSVPEEESEKMMLLLKKIKSFNTDITNLIRGEEDLYETEIRMFSKIRKEFQEWGRILDVRSDKVKRSIQEDVWRFDNQYRGRELPGFINYKSFEDIVKKYIRELEGPALEVLSKVIDIVGQSFTEVATANFPEFFNLTRAAKGRIEDIKMQQRAEAEKMIQNQFKIEQIVYCQDNFYRKALRDTNVNNVEEALKTLKFQDVNGIVPDKSPSTVELACHLEAYFNGAGHRLSSLIPLIIQSFTIRDYGDKLQNAMLQLLQEKQLLDCLLMEHKDVAAERNFLMQQINRLRKAQLYLLKVSV